MNDDLQSIISSAEKDLQTKASKTAASIEAAGTTQGLGAALSAEETQHLKAMNKKLFSVIVGIMILMTIGALIFFIMYARTIDPAKEGSKAPLSNVPHKRTTPVKSEDKLTQSPTPVNIIITPTPEATRDYTPEKIKRREERKRLEEEQRNNPTPETPLPNLPKGNMFS